MTPGMMLLVLLGLTLASASLMKLMGLLLEQGDRCGGTFWFFFAGVWYVLGIWGTVIFGSCTLMGAYVILTS